mmetsp:Transcript_5292/g.8694  ORF Transcript_5292/g.8694 Transcript_5292/m.8694 type:complete len:398 (-) Transcript_5292:281-1474(-)
MINWQFWFLRGKPPSPWKQDLNDLLHTEPYSLLANGIFWTFAFLLAPLAGSVMVCWTVVRYVSYLCGYSTKTVDPSKEQELAVVITGCDTGFGRDLALACHAKGYHVFAGCLKKESLAGLVALTNDPIGNKKMTPLVVDVCKDKDVDDLAKVVLGWVKNEEGNDKKPRFLHAIVNNAGIGNSGLVDWVDMDVYKKNMEVNCFGQIRVIKAFLPFLKTQYGGVGAKYGDARIINMVSMAGLVHCVGMTTYAASKFAAEGFSNALRMELRDFGIRVVTMNPSFHETPLTLDMVGEARSDWEKLPDDIKTRYGVDYLEKNLIEFAKVPASVMWRSENVTRDLCRAVDLVRPATRYVTGSDARFGLLIQRMLPDFINEFLLPRYLHPPAFFGHDDDSKKEK